MVRRSPGEGTIIQRNGRWVVALQVDGKRRVAYARTEREARQRLQELREQVARVGSLPMPGRRTVNDLLDQALATLRPSLKPRTIAHYESLAQSYIRPTIGTIRLSRLTPDRLQRLYTDLQDRGLTRVPRQVHALLHRVFRLAVLWCWLPENPADRVLPPTYQAPRKDVWSLEQVRTFLAATADSWLGPFWVVAIATGCRLGELLALRWTDVEWETGSITIRRNVQRIRGAWVEGVPKTRAGERTLCVPAEAVAALKSQRAHQNEWRLLAGAEWRGRGLVFSSRSGDYLSPSTVQHALRAWCERLGLPRLTPHGLRHLHASLLLAEGLPLTDISRRLGHANTGITATIYSHALPNRDAHAAQAIHRAMASL